MTPLVSLATTTTTTPLPPPSVASPSSITARASSTSVAPGRSVAAPPVRLVSTIARASSSSSSSSVDVADALLTCADSIATNGADLYASKPDGDVARAVETLVASARLGSSDDATASDVIAAGEGVYEVFNMPHLFNLSSPIGMRFKPVRYTIGARGEIRSDVRFVTPGGFAGWLSASGRVDASGVDEVTLAFDSFWVGRDGASPRDNPARAGAEGGGALGAMDALVNGLGNAGFLPSFARFPVRFFDEDAGVCVFQFPPLRSDVAAQRVSRTPSGTVF